MGYYLILIGICLLAFAIWAIGKSLLLWFYGDITTGEIIGIDEQPRRVGNGRRRIFYHPIVAFVSAEGFQFEFTYGGGSSSKRPLVGRQVIVIYPKNRPEQATLNTFGGLWTGPIACLILARGALYAAVQIVFFGV